jgi:hypothetical protein
MTPQVPEGIHRMPGHSYAGGEIRRQRHQSLSNLVSSLQTSKPIDDRVHQAEVVLMQKFRELHEVVRDVPVSRCTSRLDDFDIT